MINCFVGLKKKKFIDDNIFNPVFTTLCKNGSFQLPASSLESDLCWTFYMF